MDDRSLRLAAYFGSQSAIPGLTGMDVIHGTKGHTIYPNEDGSEDDRLKDPALHTRVAYWLKAGLTLPQLKGKVKEAGLEITGNKKVLAFRLAFKGFPANVPSPVFSSGGSCSLPSGAPERDLSDATKLDTKLLSVAGPPPATAAPVAQAAQAAPAVEDDEDDEDDDQDLYDDWVPRTASGAQKSCNVIRGEITRFLVRGTMTQTAFLQAISCNSNSYGRFMKLKGAWNGAQNGVYWGAARFFEMEKRRTAREKKRAGPEAAKRKKAGEAAARKKAKNEGAQLLVQLGAIDVPEDTPVFDTCAEVRRKITAFLKTGVMSKSAFLKHLGVAPNSFTSFMKQTGRADPHCIARMQPGAGNHLYPKAYRFFEQKRLLEGKPKIAGRTNNEAMLAAANSKQAALFAGSAELTAKYVTEGFGLQHDNGMRWMCR